MYVCMCERPEREGKERNSHSDGGAPSIEGAYMGQHEIQRRECGNESGRRRLAMVMMMEMMNEPEVREINVLERKWDRIRDELLG
jgi:hypothetical protein